jgi:pimeloyl-ACP methyl ester carboxylesterase
MSSLSIDGIDIHYEESGSGVPVVFSHGLLWSGRMFAAQTAALARDYRCIAYDHRGQGQSASSPVSYDIERLAEDAAQLILALGAAPCHFVGLSMGGFVGLRLALHRPELLRSLTLVDSAADREPRLNVPKYKLMTLFARRFGYGPLLPAVMKIMFGPAFLRDPSREKLRREQEAQLLALDPSRVEPALYAVTSRRAVLDELGRVRTPTMVVHGVDDAAIRLPRARSTAGAIPGARWVEIPRAGHTSTVEEPAAVTAALQSFFAATDQATAKAKDTSAPSELR